ncbi:MAG TPA: hypothetical protein VGO11_13750 [Chthoniobacteraceae bacterium]|jgi:hypothetical protein|nr:hypothetical protein [Chthoniobacteraceae bacterium]
MIEIRPDQMEIFEERSRASFVRRAAAYLREAHEAALSAIDEPALEALIHRQSAVAQGYGLSSELAVMQFIEIGLAFGEDFHGARKYPRAEEILGSRRDGAAKIRELLQAAERGFEP